MDFLPNTASSINSNKTFFYFLTAVSVKNVFQMCQCRGIQILSDFLGFILDLFWIFHGLAYRIFRSNLPIGRIETTGVQVRHFNLSTQTSIRLFITPKYAVSCEVVDGFECTSYNNGYTGHHHRSQASKTRSPCNWFIKPNINQKVG